MPGRALQRFVLRTGGPLDRLWRWLYDLAARAVGWALTIGTGEASVYIRGSLGSGDAVPGLSDVDLAIVAVDPEGRSRVRRRLARLTRIPGMAAFAGQPRIFESASLSRAARASAITCGLDQDAEPGALAYSGPGSDVDTSKLRERPGLTGPTGGWRRMLGPEHPLPAPVRDRQEERVAAWLELQHVWRSAYRYCAHPEWAGGTRMAMKLVADPARILLWLRRREAPLSRFEVLASSASAIPEEAETFAAARRWQRRAGSPGTPALAEALPAALRLSERIADLIAAEIGEADSGEVELERGSELILPKGGWSPPAGLAEPPGGWRLLPLADWRAIVRPHLPDEVLVPVPGDPSDPELLGALAPVGSRGPQPMLAWGSLLLSPAELWWRGALRAIESPFSDPVAHAVLAGDSKAIFPSARGWAAGDVARRAVAEHTGWMRKPGLAAPDRRIGLGRLITAARAGFFLASFSEGRPSLPLTVEVTLARLAEQPGCRGVAEVAAETYGELARSWREPSEEVLVALAGAVAGLPAYAGAELRPSAALVRQ